MYIEHKVIKRHYCVSLVTNDVNSAIFATGPQIDFMKPRMTELGLVDVPPKGHNESNCFLGSPL